MITFSFRQPLGTVPWGTSTGQLPRAHSDMGGDVGWSDLVVGGVDALWVRDDDTGAVVIVHAQRGTATRVAVAPASNGSGAHAWTAALGSAGPGRVVLLVAENETSNKTVLFRVDVCDVNGNRLHTALLPTLTGAPDAPRRIWVVGERIWVGKAARTELYDLKGRLLAHVPPGAPLQDGHYLAGGKSPRLYGNGGEYIAEINLSAPRDRLDIVLSGPDGAVLARGDEDSLPPAVRGSVVFQEVWRLDETARKLSLHERIVTPALMRAQPLPGTSGDGQPVRSYFPPLAQDFLSNGDLVRFEVASQGLRFFVQERLPDEDDWQQKFRHAEDLSRAERGLASAEYLVRIGRETADKTLAGFFNDLPWRRQPKAATAMTPSDADSILRGLDPRAAQRR